MIVTPNTLSNNTDSLVVSFTYTRRDENVSVGSITGDYILDTTGEIFQKSSHSKICRLVIIGGDNRFSHEKGDRPQLTYMTTLQKITLSNIIRAIARKNEFTTISSEDDHLKNVCDSLLRGYIG